MATVADRISALSAEDKALAKRIVAARQAKALLAELQPRIADAIEQETDASTRRAAAKAAQERAHKERSGMRGLFMNKQKKQDIAQVQYESMLGISEASRDLFDAQQKLAIMGREKAALDKTVGLLRRDAATRERTVALLDAVFDGPTPDFPEHARALEKFAAAKTAYDAIQGRVSQSATVVNNLSRASGDLRGAIKNLQDAIAWTMRDEAEKGQRDITKIFDWGNLAWMADKNVEYAAQRIEKAEKIFAEAREVDPKIGDTFKPAAGETVDGDWTQKPITAYLARRGVNVPILEECLEKLLQEVESGNDRTNALAKERDPALQAYNDAENELRDLREKILEDATQGPL